MTLFPLHHFRLCGTREKFVYHEKIPDDNQLYQTNIIRQNKATTLIYFCKVQKVTVYLTTQNTSIIICDSRSASSYNFVL